METTYKYKAFISYSHQDQKFAKWLHKKIENYKIPKSLREKYPNLPKDLKRTIFLDDEELPTASALPDNLSHALESSELLIVICSPSATQSYWVDKEIVYFKQFHGAEKVLAILKEGEPNTSYSTVYDNEVEAFPKALRYKLNENGEFTEERTESLAADARNRKNRNKALIKLIAGILKVDFSDLRERDKKERRKRRTIIGLIFTLFVSLSIYASVQLLGEQGNKELEQIKTRIATLEYIVRHHELSEEKLIALKKELKKLKKEKENKEASQKSLGKLKTSLGKKAETVYQKEGAKLAIAVLTSKEALSNQEARMKEVSREKVALADLYIETDELMKAKKSFEDANDLFFDIYNAGQYIGFLVNYNYNSEAKNILEKLLKEKISKEEESLLFLYLAKIYFRMGEESKSDEYMNYALNLMPSSESTEYQLIRFAILAEMAQYSNMKNENELADKMYTKAIKIAQSLLEKESKDFKPHYGEIINAYAEFCTHNSMYTKAEKLYKKAIKVSQSLIEDNRKKFLLFHAKNLRDLAQLYMKINKYDKTQEIYNKMENLLIFTKNNKSLIFIYKEIGKYYSDTAQYDKGKKVYKEAMHLARILAQKNPEVYNPQYAEILIEAASFYINMNKYDEAEKTYLKAIEFYQLSVHLSPNTYNLNIAETYTQLGNLYGFNNKNEKELESYKKALKLFELLKKTDVNYYGVSLMILNLRLAYFYMKIKQYNNAEEKYKKALILFPKVPIPVQELFADTLRRIADLHDAMDKENEAEKEYKKSLKIYYKIVEDTDENISDIMNVLRQFGEYYRRTNQYVKLEQLYTEALNKLGPLVIKNPDKYNQYYEEISKFLINIPIKSKQLEDSKKEILLKNIVTSLSQD